MRSQTLAPKAQTLSQKAHDPFGSLRVGPRALLRLLVEWNGEGKEGRMDTVFQAAGVRVVGFSGCGVCEVGPGTLVPKH